MMAATHTPTSCPSDAVSGIRSLGLSRLWSCPKEGSHCYSTEGQQPEGWELPLLQGSGALKPPRNVSNTRSGRPQPCPFPSPLPDGVGQGQDAQHEEVHGKEKVDVLLREYLQEKPERGELPQRPPRLQLLGQSSRELRRAGITQIPAALLGDAGRSRMLAERAQRACEMSRVCELLGSKITPVVWKGGQSLVRAVSWSEAPRRCRGSGSTSTPSVSWAVVRTPHTLPHCQTVPYTLRWGTLESSVLPQVWN